MKKVSFVFPVKYGVRGPKEKYMPAIINLGENICCCYGISFPRKYEFTNEPIDKFCLSRIPTIYSKYIIGFFQKIFKFPAYEIYWANIKLFDLLFANKVARDESEIVFTHPLLNRTIDVCRKAGKYVIVEAPNSEPNREYKRVNDDYEDYHIKNRFIYGEIGFRNTWVNGYRNANKIITISKLSTETYINGGYDKEKLKLIPLTGSDFLKKSIDDNRIKKRMFISCAHHSFVKGTHRLLLAWKKAEINNIPLCIVGKINQDVEEFIQKKGPFKNVIFAGEKENLVDFYKGIDGVGVQLSLSEGAVRVVPEMMAFGFPMITTYDASCDLVVDNETGYIVDAYNEDQIIDKLRYVANNWDSLSTIRKNVVNKLNDRTVSDFSIELSQYLRSLL